MTGTATDDQPAAPTPPGIVCPRCRGTDWKVDETRQLPRCLLRIRTCAACHIRIRSREKFEAVHNPLRLRKPRAK